MSSRVVVVVFEGFQTLDALGPAEVFYGAQRAAPESRYDVVLASSAGGSCRTASGLQLQTQRLLPLRPQPGDTVLVAGADPGPLSAALSDAPLLAWLRRAARIVRRIG